MLGISSGINTDKGYAPGERFRERFHIGGTYNAGSNPIGFKGKEADYIGDFAESTDDDNFATTNSSISIYSATLRVSSSATNGYASIAFSTTVGVGYTVVVDVAGIQSGNAALVQIGNSAGAYALYNSGNVTSTATKTATFTATAKITYLTLRSKTNSKWINFDNISLKES